MAKPTERREELKRFLRAHRERLRPEECGVPRRPRRRTPGLRREEVAELAGVSVAWYSWLEMGRDIRVSAKMLDGVGRALRLNDDEISHLFTLAGTPKPDAARGLNERVPPWVRQVMERFGGAAYFVGARLDVLAWNARAARLFDFEKTDDPLHCNIVWRMCTDPKKRELHPDWAADVEHTIASFRSHYGYHAGNPHFEALLATLQSSSEDFRRIWPQQNAAKRLTRTVTLYRPEIGTFALDLTNLPNPEDRLQHVVFGWPKCPPALAAKVEQFLSAGPSRPPQPRTLGEALGEAPLRRPSHVRSPYSDR